MPLSYSSRATFGPVIDARSKGRLYEFMHARSKAVIATADRTGNPEAALINIAVTVDLEILFETTSATRKFANLETNPNVSFVIGWDDEKTLQYDGIVDRPDGKTLKRVLSCYLSQFPEKASHQYWPGNEYFRARPLWIRLSDYYAPRKIEEYRCSPCAPISPSWWHRLLGSEGRQHN